jgi:hypothetical protein
MYIYDYTCVNLLQVTVDRKDVEKKQKKIYKKGSRYFHQKTEKNDILKKYIYIYIYIYYITIVLRLCIDLYNALTPYLVQFYDLGVRSFVGGAILWYCKHAR